MAKDRLRVLHLITDFQLGGAQDNTLETVRRLDRSRYHVALAGGSEGELVDDARSLADEFFIIPGLQRAIHPYRDAVALISLIRFLRRNRFDIVHTHSSKAGLLGRAAAWWAKVPVVVHTIHGFPFNDFQPSWERCLFVWLERWAARRCHHLITVSKLNVEEALQNGIGHPDQYTTIYSGIDRSRFLNPVDPCEFRAELGIPPEAPLIGMVGRLSEQKAPEHFVEAAAIIADRYPEARFVMVGDGPLRGRVESLVKKLNLADKLFLTGTRRDIPRILAAVDILAIPSLWEGMGRIFAEAMTMGKPIIACRVNGVPEAVIDGENGFLVPPANPAAFAEAVMRLINDPVRSRIMGERGRERSVLFDVNTMVSAIDELYQRLWTQYEVNQKGRVTAA